MHAEVLVWEVDACTPIGYISATKELRPDDWEQWWTGDSRYPAHHGHARAAALQPEEFKPGSHYQTEEELAQAAGEIGTTIFHPVGTAKMGPDDDANAVVDHRLRVRGVEGLRVIDASVMPCITSGNTNSPTLMIAERGAEMVIADSR